MEIYETIQDIEELRTFCRRQNVTIKELREKLDFETNVTKELKNKIASYDYRYGNLESRNLFYEKIINYLIER